MARSSVAACDSACRVSCCCSESLVRSILRIKPIPNAAANVITNANASVAATEHDTPHLAQREYLFTLKYEHQGADFLLYSYDDIDFGAARRIVTDELTAGRFGFHAERPNFVVLRRGAPVDRNAELLQRLGVRE